MDQETVTNNALRTLRFKNMIKESDSAEMQMILEGVWAAGWEYYKAKCDNDRRGTSRPVDYYNPEGNKVGSFKSITEASNELIIPRKTICDNLKYPNRRMRNRHYFRYTKKETE